MSVLRRSTLPVVLGPAVLAVMALLAFLPAVSQAACANAIACENQLPGASPDDWEVDTIDSTIQGFGTSMSVNKGSTISFKVKSATSNYRIDIYRLGYYGGDGARLWQSNLSHTGPGRSRRASRRRARGSSTAATGPCLPLGRCRPTQCQASTSLISGATTPAAAA